MWKHVHVDSLTSSKENPVDSKKPAGDAKDEKPLRYGSVTISSACMSANSMIEIGYGDLAKGSVAGDVFYYLIDVSACTGDIRLEEAPDRSLTLKKMGIGFRVAIAAWKLDASASTNLGTVAASVELGAAQTSIQATAYANKISQLGMIAEISKFNSRKFDASVIKELAEYVSRFTTLLGTAEKEKIMPTPCFEIRLHPKKYNPQHIVASNYFAVVAIDNAKPRSSLDGWLVAKADKKEDQWPGIISPVVVQAAYECFGEPGYNQSPKAANQKLANGVHRLGA